MDAKEKARAKAIDGQLQVDHRAVRHHFGVPRWSLLLLPPSGASKGPSIVSGPLPHHRTYSRAALLSMQSDHWQVGERIQTVWPRQGGESHRRVAGLSRIILPLEPASHKRIRNETLWIPWQNRHQGAPSPPAKREENE